MEIEIEEHVKQSCSFLCVSYVSIACHEINLFISAVGAQYNGKGKKDAKGSKASPKLENFCRSYS